MATRIALEQELPATPLQAFAHLRGRDFTLRRLALEPALDADLTDYESSEADLRLGVNGELPSHWMPPGVNATPSVQRRETWTSHGDGFAGTLSMIVNGLPIRCEGRLELQSWQEITVISLLVDVEVSLPFIGPTVERMIRDRIGPAFAAEFELLATELADP